MYQIIYLHVTKHHLRCNSTEKGEADESCIGVRAFVRACVLPMDVLRFVWHAGHCLHTEHSIEYISEIGGGVRRPRQRREQIDFHILIRFFCESVTIVISWHTVSVSFRFPF